MRTLTPFLHFYWITDEPIAGSELIRLVIGQYYKRGVVNIPLGSEETSLEGSM